MKPKLNSTIFLLFTLFSSAFCQSQTNENIDPKAYSLKKEAKFEENKGQVTGLDSKQVKFIYQQDNLSLFLLNNGISYQFNKTHPLTEKSKELSMETYRMDLVLVNSNLNTEILKEGKSISMDNYYNHNALDVHTYTKITYLNVYPNIDWVIYKTNSNVKYDFIVHPGGNVNSIKLQTKWVKELKLNADGSVILQGDEHYIKEDKPVSYQGVEIIDTKFKLNKGVLSFDVSNYDITKTLIIDPTLTWATYYGGTNKDIAESCVTDKQGNVYMSGSTWSNNYIASGGHQNSYSANADAFLVKFNNQGVRQWATYYGGAGVEEGLSCSVDNIGNVCLAGNTKSTANISFNGHQNTHGGSATGDAFLVKFNSQGIRQWATYYGGSNNDFANSCAMNALGEIYILGETSSTNNIAFNGYQITYFTGASNMAFLAKFNANGTREWASYFGTNGGTTGKSCAIDNLGKVYISGHTYSTSNFAFNGHQNTIGSLSYTDAYLAKLNESGSLVWSTYYGGSQDDKAYSCSVDINGNVFLAGSTASNTNIAFNGYMNSLNAGYNTFLVKFNSSGTRLWGTYYGGSSAVCSTDKFGNVYLAGNAPSLNGIALWGIQNINGGLIDAYLVKFNASGSRKWGTYYGGTEIDLASACATDTLGNVFLAGTTQSCSGIAINGFQNICGGNNFSDGFLVKIDGTNPCHTEFSYTHSICQGSSYLFNGIQRDTSGLYIDTLVNAFACDSIIRVSLEVIDALMPELVINSNLGNVICQDTQVVFTANAINGGTVPIYQWQKNGINTGTGSSTYSINNLVNGDSIICILTSNLNCISSPTVNSNSIIMTVNSLPPMPTIIANGNVLSSSANNGNQWYLNGNLIPGANGQSLTANQNGNYTVLVTNNCGSTSSGIFTYSITSINNHEQLYFTIYPNPTRNNFSILGLNINEKFSVNIIDNTGRVIQNFYNHDVIDVSSLAEGFYWVEIIQNNTKNISKLIKY